MRIISLERWNVFRPEKICWQSILQPGQDVLSSFPSKSTRKFLQKSDEIKHSLGVTSEISQANREDFESFFQFYTKTMIDQNHSVLLSVEWYGQKLLEQKKVYILQYFLGRERIGAGLMVESQQRVSFAYKAHIHMEFPGSGNMSIGSLMEYDFLRFGQELRGSRSLSSGSARNAFGALNTYGYLASKLRFGYAVEAVPSEKEVCEASVSDAGDGCFFGHGPETSVLSLYALGWQGELHDDQREILRRIPELIRLE